MRRSEARPQSGGFTLVEVLIAMTLSAALITLFFSALHTYSKTSVAGHQEVQRKQEKDAVFDFIRRQFNEIVPLSTASSQAARALFEGSDRRIVYVGRIPSHQAPGGLHRNTINITGTGPDLALGFSYAPLQSADDFDIEAFFGPAPATSRRLLDGFTAITFEYFGAPEPDAEAAWQTVWKRTDALPEAIRITTQEKDARSVERFATPVFAHTLSAHKAMTIGGRRADNNRATGTAPDTGDASGARISAGRP